MSVSDKEPRRVKACIIYFPFFVLVKIVVIPSSFHTLYMSLNPVNVFFAQELCIHFNVNKCTSII